MSPAPFDFGELRSLLQQPPSAQVWGRLCELAHRRVWADEAERWVPYAADYMDRSWPDALRAWDVRWQPNQRCPMTPLVRAAKVGGNGRARRAALRSMAIHRPPLTTLSVEERQDADLPLVVAMLPETLRRLTIEVGEPWAPLRDWPGLGALDALDLGAPIPALRDLITRLHTRELSLRGRGRGEGLAGLIVYGALPDHIESLNLHSIHLTREDTQRLGRAAWRRLDALSLHGMSGAGEWLGTLLAQEGLSGLRALSVSASASQEEENITAMLSRAHPALRLRALDCATRSLGALPALLALPILEGLESLALSASPVAPDELSALAASGHNLTLRSLTLRHAPGGADAIMRSLCGASWPALESLELMVCGLGDAHLDALGAADLPRLHTLRLRDDDWLYLRDGSNVFSGEAIERLLDGPLGGQLKTLTFNYTHISPNKVTGLHRHPAVDVYAVRSR